MFTWGGSSLCRSLSTERGSPFMGKHFKCKVYTDGQLSFGVEVEESRPVAGIVLFAKTLERTSFDICLSM